MPSHPSRKSMAQVIDACDNHPYTNKNTNTTSASSEAVAALHLMHSDGCNQSIKPIGWIRPHFGAAVNDYFKQTGIQPFLLEQVTESGGVFWCFDEDFLGRGMDVVNEGMAKMVRKMRDDGMFKECLDGWRNELYAVYGDPTSSFFKLPRIRGTASVSQQFHNHAFSLERSACALFGLVTYGVHMTVYEGEGKDMKIWVPKRSATKATWPSMLDNSVAGGIPAGMNIFECLVKECDEEASLPEKLVRERVKPTGVATYFYVTDKGWLQPECEFIFDLQMPSQSSPDYVKLRPHDEEVESFSLLPLATVLSLLSTSPPPFKPNCGLILLDFLIRHGMVTPDNESRYLEVVRRCHRDFGMAMPEA